MEELYTFIGCFYFILIPFLFNQAFWEKENPHQGYLSWYFSYNKDLTTLGNLCLWLLGLGSVVWFILFWILERFVAIPLFWILEKLFCILFIKECGNDKD